MSSYYKKPNGKWVIEGEEGEYPNKEAVKFAMKSGIKITPPKAKAPPKKKETNKEKKARKEAEKKAKAEAEKKAKEEAERIAAAQASDIPT